MTSARRYLTLVLKRGTLLRQFRHRPDRAIAGSRIGLALASLYIAWLDAHNPAGTPEVVLHSVIASYFVYALLTAISVWRLPRPDRGRGAILQHALDFTVLAALMGMTGGPESPYFMFVPFVLISAALLWNWRGALFAAIGAIGVLVVLLMFDPWVPMDPDTDSTLDVSRMSFIAVSALLLVWVGVSEGSVQTTLRRVAHRPSPVQSTRDWPWEAALEYIEFVTRMPRIVLIWRLPGEPWSYAAVSDNRGRRLQRILATDPVDNGAEDDGRAAALATSGHAKPVAADPSEFGTAGDAVAVTEAAQQDRAALLRGLGATQAVATPLRLSAMEGEILFLDPPVLGGDLEHMAEIVAERVANLFDQARRIRQMMEQAEMEQRLRVANDLHDGVLQTLAGTALQLEEVKGLAMRDPEKAVERVQAIQFMLAKEQRDLRASIDALEIDAAGAARTVAQEPRFASLAAQLLARWGMEISFRVEPADLRLPAHLSDELCQLATEATANAAKHGRARSVSLLVQRGATAVDLVVEDDGAGFGLGRLLHHHELAARGVGPVRLRLRAERSAGQVTVDDGGGATQVRIRLPLGAAP